MKVYIPSYFHALIYAAGVLSSATLASIPAMAQEKGASLQTEFSEPTASYEDFIDQAENFIKSEDWLNAEKAYRNALRLNPGSPLNSKIFANLALCLTHQGKMEEALANYDIALIKEPDSPSILTSKSSALILTGDLNGAEDNLVHALKIDSLYPSALRLHGQIMLINNRLEEADVDFTRLMKADPSDSWGPSGLAEIRLAQDLPMEAIGLLKKALMLHESQDYRISLIAALLRSKKYADAEDAIREALVNYPNQGEFYLLRAILHKTLHQNREAETDKKYAIEYGVDPQIIEKYINIPK